MNFNEKLILGSIFVCVILNTFVGNNDEFNFNPSYSSVQSVVTLNVGRQNRSLEYTPNTPLPQALEQTINRCEILRKHFPDWEERMDYQKKQEKIYRSGLARIAEAKRVGVKFKLTKQEQDAFDYFNGQNFYNYYQSLETPPNLYDTMWSFLLKVEKNKNMRENFLKSYNQIENEN